MAKAAKARTPDVLPADPPGGQQLQVVSTEGASIVKFMGGLKAFFVKAEALEVQAKGQLATARTLAIPSDGAQDVALQEFIKATNAQKREVEDTWGICQAVSAFHKRLTGKRSIATTALEEAATLANRLHNAYVTAENRRVAEENERIRREAEEKERARIQQEAAKLEADAEAREAASADLSDRERAFVEYYVLGGNAEASAKRSGFKDALRSAARLVGSDKIQHAIKAKRESEALRQQATAKRAQPIDVQVNEVQADVQRAPGASSRKYPGAELLDANALRAAVIEGKFGIPVDVLMVDERKLREYAKSIGNLINRWPGVRYTEDSKVV